jgi:thiaminase
MDVDSVLRFLHDNKYYHSLLVLQQESNCKLKTYPEELDYMYDLMLNGDYSQILSVLNPIRVNYNEIYEEIYFELITQELLEKINTCTYSTEFIASTIKQASADVDKVYVDKIYQKLHSCFFDEFKRIDVWESRVLCWQSVCSKIQDFLYDMDS